MWKDGIIFVDGKAYEYSIKVYDLPSNYGIKNGRISKLRVYDGIDIILDYDRGWGTGYAPKPKRGSHEEKVLNAILNMYPVIK